MQSKLKVILGEFYGLSSVRIAEVQGGWSAAAYRVDSARGQYFLKVYDRSMPSIRQWTDRIGHYLPALIYLARHSPLAGRTSRPIASPGGEYVYQDGEWICLLFEFIEGTTVGARPLTRSETIELAQIAAGLHAHGAQIDADTSNLAEDISLSFCANLRRYLLGGARCDEELDAALGENRNMLIALCDEAELLRDSARAPQRALCLCHTDMHNFNIMKANGLVLIDWEGLRLAPPESDLFMLDSKPHWADFLAEYSRLRPGFEPDGRLMRFYHLRRQAEDIWDSLARLLEDDPPESVRRETREMTLQVIDETKPYMA